MRSAPLVTVIIPTYNSSITLRQAAESVLNQDLGDYEVWVAGDGCTDASEEVIASFGDDRLHWTNLPVNSGTPSAPRNEGLRLAKGRYIAYLGHDDLWFPWHLSELVDCMQSGQRWLVHSLGAIYKPSGTVRAFKMTSPSNWLHDRELVDICGQWSLHERHGVDKEFLSRVSRAGIQPIFHHQLSVLKFPSLSWELYKRKSPLPQPEFMRRMQEDPKELQLSVLSDIAVAACSNDSVLSWKDFVRQFKHLTYTYARQRWPLNHLHHWRTRRKRGLSVKLR